MHRSRNTSLKLLAVLALAAPTLAAPQAAARVALAGGRVSFVPPPGFTRLSAAEVRLKFPRGKPPEVVYGDERRAISVAIGLRENRVTPAQLPELKAVIESSIEGAVPGIRWLKRELTSLGGTRWVHLEFTSPAIDTTIHNDQYFTSLGGKLLAFNFNATVARWARAEADLRGSRDSIQLKP